MLKHIAMLSPLLLAGACSTDESAGPIESGRWQIMKEVVKTDFEERGVADTEALASEMNAQNVCLAAEEVSPVPTGKLFGGNSDIDCQYENIAFADGKMSSDVTCAWPDSGEATGSIHGTYTATSFEAEWTVEQEVDGETKSTTGAISGTNTGIC